MTSNAIILYPVLGLLLNLAKTGRYQWPAYLASGALSGYLITNHGPSATILGGILTGLLAGGWFKKASERAALAVVFFMVVYFGSYPVGLMPFAVLVLAALADCRLAIRGLPVFINAVILLMVVLDEIGGWTAVAFLLGVAIYTYNTGGTVSGKKDRRYSGFRRRN